MKKKIAVIVIYKFNLNDYNTFNFKRLKKLFNVSFFDLSNIFLRHKIIVNPYKKNSVENKINNYFILKNLKDLGKKLKSFDYILDFTFLFLKNKFKRNKIKKYLYEVNKIKNIQKITILSGSIPNFFNHKLLDKLKFLLIILCFIFKSKKYSYLLFFIKKFFLEKNKKNNLITDNKFYYDYVMISDIFWEKFTDSYFPRAKKVFTHYKDYEKYLFFRNNCKIITEDYFVFLDEDLFDHPDNFSFYQSFLIKHKEKLKKKYFYLVNKFFYKFEKTTGLKIIIAAHPKNLNTQESNDYCNRSFIKNKTFELIKNSKGVFAHSSTSVSMAVLLNKPLFFLYSKIMFDLGNVTKILSFAIETKAQFINIDLNNINFLELVKKRIKNNYNSYISRYIRYIPSEKFSMWDKLSKILK